MYPLILDMKIKKIIINWVKIATLILSEHPACCYNLLLQNIKFFVYPVLFI